MTIKELMEMLDGLPQNYEVTICTEEDEESSTEVNIARYIYVTDEKVTLYLKENGL